LRFKIIVGGLDVVLHPIKRDYRLAVHARRRIERLRVSIVTVPISPRS
jgi:hypothetical protein